MGDLAEALILVNTLRDRKRQAPYRDTDCQMPMDRTNTSHSVPPYSIDRLIVDKNNSSDEYSDSTGNVQTGKGCPFHPHTPPHDDTYTIEDGGREGKATKRRMVEKMSDTTWDSGHTRTKGKRGKEIPADIVAATVAALRFENAPFRTSPSSSEAERAEEGADNLVYPIESESIEHEGGIDGYVPESGDDDMVDRGSRLTQSERLRILQMSLRERANRSVEANEAWMSNWMVREKRERNRERREKRRREKRRRGRRKNE